MGNNNHRETLFRGFHPCEDGKTTIYVEGEAVTGWWVEGWLAVTSERIAHINVFKSDDGEEVIVTTHPVLSSTVCQYTGLTDKNGVKIFKGDILGAEDCDYSFCVEFGKCGGVENCESYGYIGYCLTPHGDETRRCTQYGLRDDPLYWVLEHGVEVIGTIWDKEDEQ